MPPCIVMIALGLFCERAAPATENTITYSSSGQRRVV
jgi:hypothetical protein